MLLRTTQFVASDIPKDTFCVIRVGCSVPHDNPPRCRDSCLFCVIRDSFCYCYGLPVSLSWFVMRIFSVTVSLPTSLYLLRCSWPPPKILISFPLFRSSFFLGNWQWQWQWGEPNDRGIPTLLP